jgi:hypothetical protein
MSALEQPELALARAPAKTLVPVELIRSRRSAGAAFTLACDASGLEDKEIYLALGVDAGTFSRMKAGKNTLGADLVADFCRVVGNTIYPEWLVYQVGCGLVVLKTEAERRAEQAEARAEDAEKKLAWAMDLLRGKG